MLDRAATMPTAAATVTTAKINAASTASSNGASTNGAAHPDQRLPPHDLAAEQSMLGGMLLSEQAIPAVLAVLAGEQDLYRPAHQTIYRRIVEMHQRGTPADAITVAAELQRRGELLRLGGAPYLHTLIAGVPTAANADHYAGIVAEHARRRRGLEVLTRGVQRLYESDQDAAAVLAHTLDDLTTAAAAAAAGPDRTAPGTRQLRVVRASEVTTRRQRWLWAERIVLGGLTLLAGREGLGKSTLACDLAAQLTRGALDGEHQGEPRTVIYVHTEDARDTTIVPRLAAAGADLDRVVFLDAVGFDEQGAYETQLVFPTDVEQLAGLVVEHDAALVVLDAATSVIDGRLDGDKDRQMRRALEAIARGVGERTGCAVLGIVHFGKRESGDTGKLILGSIAWSQVARSVLAVARDEDTGELVLSTTKANLAPGDTPSLSVRLVDQAVPTGDGDTTHVGRVEWLGETTLNARDLLSSPEPETDTPGETDEAVEWLNGYLIDHGGSDHAGDVLKAARKDGIAERTLQRARKKAGISTGRVGKVWYWSLEGATEGAKDDRP